MYLEVSPMYEKGNNHLTSAHHMRSNLKKKVDGLMHGIELQYLENELADFKWKTITRIIRTNINTWTK